MKYVTLPKKITSNGKTYVLDFRECDDDKMFLGYWSCSYTEQGCSETKLPAQATDGHEIYYLCSVQSSKKETEEDMLDRLNRMTKIMTEQDIKKQSELWEKRKNKIFMKNRLLA